VEMLTLPFSGTELGAQDSTVELLGVQTDSTLLGVQTGATLLGVHTDSTAEVLGVQTDSTAVVEVIALEGVHHVLVHSALTTVAAVAIKAIVEIDILDI